MRARGLAEGLKKNGVDVTVGVNNSFPLELSEHEDIKLVNWGQDEQFAELINTFDAVIISYTMGSDSVFVAEHINDNVQLILDAYVPIYVEVSARESKDIDTEYRHYMDDIVRFNKVLRRGDYFLCASDAQKTFYIGVLSSLGIINPRSYRQDRILIAPFGIHDLPPKATRDPYAKLGIEKSDFTAMWFGGLYPWFRVQELLDAVLELSKDPQFKFVVVGGRNPFNPNLDFAKQYEIALEFARKHKLLDKSVFFIDWVDYNDRVNYFKNADVVVSLNQPGQENGFSWRTRVMDFVWGELAILTNGGDPLSEDLIAVDAALRLPELSSEALVKNISDLQKNPKLLSSIHKQILAIKPKYYWQNIMDQVAKLIKAGDKPYAAELAYKTRLGIGFNEELSGPSATPASGTVNKVRKLARAPRKVVSYARHKGLRRSARVAVNITRTQARKHLSANRKRRYIFISHPINNTGAPLVLLQIVEEYARKYGGAQVMLVTPSIEPPELAKLHRLGVKVDKAALGISFRMIRLQLGLRHNDFVLLNTVAIYDNYRDFILLWVRTGRLKHAYWFIHEDQAQLPIIHKEFLDQRNLDQMHQLMESGRLSVLTPSKRTKDEYSELLKSDTVRPIHLRIEVPDKCMRQRTPEDYATLRFLLSGTPSDGRKGQMLALAAFHSFKTSYYDKNPVAYRDFKLHLVAIGNDYVSQQIKWISGSLLADNVMVHSSLPKDDAMKVSDSCNAVICCSLNETFALYVAEGMLMGHLVLRNNSAGMDEQLKEGKNGYFIDHTNIQQFASVLEKLLNKKTTSDADLQKMGASSQNIIADYTKHTYLSQIEETT